MVIATLLAAVGILTDSAIRPLGAMVVGPEFGPLAALCLAIVMRRAAIAGRSLSALVVGFTVAIAASWGLTLVLRALELTPTEAALEARSLDLLHLAP